MNRRSIIPLFFTMGIANMSPCQEIPSEEALISRENYVRSSFYDIHDIKVERIDGSKISGRLIYLDRLKIVVASTSQKRQTIIKAEEIQLVYVRPRGATATGALAGLGVGLVTGYVVGSVSSDTGGGGMPSMSGAKLAGIAGLSAAIIGGLIGSRRTPYPINGKPSNLTDLGLRLRLEKGHENLDKGITK
jgi:hypothetical protein